MPPSKRGSKRQTARDCETPRSSHQNLEADDDKSPITSPENSETGNGNGNRTGNDDPERLWAQPQATEPEIRRYSPTE
jgi:hypothetical protein